MEYCPSARGMVSKCSQNGVRVLARMMSKCFWNQCPSVAGIRNLNDALRQMQEKFAESSAFSEIDPEDGIGVYSALEALGYDDIDFKFRRALQKQFQFEEMIGMFK